MESQRQKKIGGLIQQDLADILQRAATEGSPGILISVSKVSVTDTADSPAEKGALISFSHQLPTLKQIEQLLIDEALKRANNNQSIAALSLGISRQALNKRLKKKAEQQGFA